MAELQLNGEHHDNADGAQHDDDGEQCDACDTRITKEQLAMEGIASTHTDEKPIQFHVKCFYVWDAERRRAIAPPRDSTLVPALAL
jgi:hypothetical protein